MDVSKEVQIILRGGGYDTWEWSGGTVPLVYFENDVILGFVYLFDDSIALKNEWQKTQDEVIKKFKPNFKAAGNKAWNVYSIFLATSESEDDTLDYIEEDFKFTRKIARTNIVTKKSIESALLSMLPIVNRPVISETDFTDNLRTNLSKINKDAAIAIINKIDADVIAQILAGK